MSRTRWLVTPVHFDDPEPPYWPTCPLTWQLAAAAGEGVADTVKAIAAMATIDAEAPNLRMLFTKLPAQP